MNVESSYSAKDPADGSLRILKVGLDYADLLRLAYENKLQGWKLRPMPDPLGGEDRVVIAKKDTGGYVEIPVVEAYRLMQRWADKFLAWSLLKEGLITREKADEMIGKGTSSGQVAD